MNNTVGIITFHNTTNFGSFLQTLGLYQAVIDYGFDCYIIDYRCEAIDKKELPLKRPQSLSARNIAKFMILEPIKRKKHNEFEKTINSTLKLTNIYHKNDIKESNNIIDIFITGSDILWDLELTEGDTTYFLDFVNENKKRIAYGTSIGQQWGQEQSESIINYLKKYDNIALREEESAKWLSELLNNKVEGVCDPTMLMTSEYWIRFSEKSKLLIENSKKYILVYFPTAQVISDAQTFALKNNLEVYVINYGLHIPNVVNIKPYKIEDFLRLVYCASLVLTSSYHGVLFSIYFKVPFYAYLRENSHNIRFESLLSKLGLCDRLRKVNKKDDISTFIDFDEIEQKINLWRKKSLNLLEEYLK